MKIGNSANTAAIKPSQTADRSSSTARYEVVTRMNEVMIWTRTVLSSSGTSSRRSGSRAGAAYFSNIAAQTSAAPRTQPRAHASHSGARRRRDPGIHIHEPSIMDRQRLSIPALASLSRNDGRLEINEPQQRAAADAAGALAGAVAGVEMGRQASREHGPRAGTFPSSRCSRASNRASRRRRAKSRRHAFRRKGLAWTMPALGWPGNTTCGRFS